MPKGEWERLAKASAKSLMQTEAFLSYLANMYLKTEGVPAEKLAVEIPAAFMRTARALLLARDLEKDDVDLEKVETILRQKLEPGPFPPRFTPVTASERVAAAKAAGATAIKPDNLPALSFAEGAVVEDVSALARAKNLFLGCRVSTARGVRGVKKGAEGKLVSLGREALVLWDEGALVDSEEGGQHERLIPIASVQMAVAAPEKPEVGKKVAAGAAAVHLPACMPWAKLTPEMAVEGLEQLVVGVLYQMFACRSAGPDQVVIESEGSGRIFSNINVKPRGLIVLPHVRELAEGVAKSRPRKFTTVKPQVWVKVGETEYRYMLGAPASEAAVDAKSEGDAEAGESPPPMCDLFLEDLQLGESRGRREPARGAYPCRNRGDSACGLRDHEGSSHARGGQEARRVRHRLGPFPDKQSGAVPRR